MDNKWIMPTGHFPVLWVNRLGPPCMELMGRISDQCAASSSESNTSEHAREIHRACFCAILMGDYAAIPFHKEKA